jgi:hypothetical protein
MPIFMASRSPSFQIRKHRGHDKDRNRNVPALVKRNEKQISKENGESEHDDRASTRRSWCLGVPHGDKNQLTVVHALRNANPPGLHRAVEESEGSLVAKLMSEWRFSEGFIGTPRSWARGLSACNTWGVAGKCSDWINGKNSASPRSGERRRRIGVSGDEDKAHQTAGHAASASFEVKIANGMRFRAAPIIFGGAEELGARVGRGGT